MKKILFIATIFCVTLGYGYQQQPYYERDSLRQTQPTAAANSYRRCGTESENPKDKIMDFSWQFFKAVNNEAPSENLVVNPTTVQQLLSALAVGADGKTFNELCTVGKFSEPRDFENILRTVTAERVGTSKNELSMVSALFLNQGTKLNENFRNSIGQNTLATTVDFSQPKSIETVNKWANEATRGTIPQILNPTGQYTDTKILLASAAYFRGEWRDTFKSAGNKIFRTDQKTVSEVPFMRIQKNFRNGEIFSDIDKSKQLASWVEIPYTDDKFNMLIILPTANVLLSQVIQELDLKPFIKNTVLNEKSDVKLVMPKFELRNTKSLVNPVQSMGITTLFNENANLNHLLDGQKAHVSDMTQEAFISVDERGTKASAVSTLNVISLSAHYPDETINFVVDRPFLAIIFEKESNIPLFFAKVMYV